jgi:hypothetical protein
MVSSRRSVSVIAAVAIVVAIALGWGVKSWLGPRDSGSPEFVEFAAVLTSVSPDDSGCVTPTDAGVRSSLGSDVCGPVAVEPGESPRAGDVVHVSWFMPSAEPDQGERDVMVLDLG